MSADGLDEELTRRRSRAALMGGPERLEKRRANGVMNARERLGYLLDPGSFKETGMLAFSIRTETRDRSPADGKISGFGRIAGRDVAVVANDFTVLGASSSQINMKKMGHMKRVASEKGMPLVLLGESSGGRMPDRMGATGRATIGQDPAEYRRVRQSPWVSALMGECYGSSTWYSCMSDFVVMRRGAIMAVSSPRVTSLAINQPIDAETLGGAKLHTEITGLVDAVRETDAEVLDAIKDFLSYLPGHCNEMPPVLPVPPGSGDQLELIGKIVPASRSQVYDVRKVIDAIVDRGSRLDIKAKFGRALVTSLARLDGRSIGIIANNPMYKGGAIDPDACDKAVSFMVLCDSYNIPLVFLVDVPGFLVGVEGERKRAPGKIINWMNALSLVTVPKITVILRKSYGQAYLNMGGGRNSDEVAVWPSADLGFMDPRLGVHVLHGVKEEDDPERFRELVEELGRDTSAWDLAGLYEAQEVIDPKETRGWLIRTLGIYRARLSGGIGQHHLRSWPTSF